MTLLLVFSQLVRLRKMTAVAEQLGLTQSAISHNLKRLREVFDDELFIRKPHGLEPTGRALALQRKVEAILELAGEALNIDRAFDPSKQERTVRVGALDYEQVLFAAPLVEAIRSAAPSMRVVFRPLARKAVIDAMAAGEVDIALGYFFRPHEDIAKLELFTETYKVVMRKGHKLGKSKLTARKYAEADHLLVSLSGDLRGIVDTALQRLGLERRVLASVPLFLPALEAVAKSDLIATVPARLAARFGGRYGLSWADPPIDIRPFTVHMAWHRRTATEPALVWFREVMADIASRSELAR